MVADRGLRRAFLVLIGAALVLAASGCTRARQLSNWFRGTVLGDAMQVAGPGDIPADVLANGPYLASTLASRATKTPDGQIVAAVSSSRFERGTNQFFVVNKWGKLKPDRYVERVQILGPDRRTEIDTDSTPFEVDDFWSTTTVVSGFRMSLLEPGTYWVRVFLNDEQMTEYPFRVTPRER